MSATGPSEVLKTALECEGLCPSTDRTPRDQTVTAQLARLRQPIHRWLLKGWTWGDVQSWLLAPRGPDGERLRGPDGELISIRASLFTVRNVVGPPPQRKRPKSKETAGQSARARTEARVMAPPARAPPAAHPPTRRDSEDLLADVINRVGGIDFDRLSGHRKE